MGDFHGNPYYPPGCNSVDPEPLYCDCCERKLKEREIERSEMHPKYANKPLCAGCLEWALVEDSRAKDDL